MELGNSLGMCSPLFFQGLQPGKTGPLSQPGARLPFQCGWRVILFIAHLVLITSDMYSSACPLVNEPPVSVTFHLWSAAKSSSNIAQIIELSVTAELTLAAAAMYVSSDDEERKFLKWLVNLFLCYNFCWLLSQLFCNLWKYFNVTQIKICECLHTNITKI